MCEDENSEKDFEESLHQISCQRDNTFFEEDSRVIDPLANLQEESSDSDQSPMDEKEREEGSEEEDDDFAMSEIR